MRKYTITFTTMDFMTVDNWKALLNRKLRSDLAITEVGLIAAWTLMKNGYSVGNSEVHKLTDVVLLPRENALNILAKGFANHPCLIGLVNYLDLTDQSGKFSRKTHKKKFWKLGDAVKYLKYNVGCLKDIEKKTSTKTTE